MSIFKKYIIGNYKKVCSRDDVVEKFFTKELLIHDEVMVSDEEKEDHERRVRDVDTCIRLDNYFATLSAVIGLMRDSEHAECGVVLDKIKQDLDYLQENYTIVKRKDDDFF